MNALDLFRLDGARALVTGGSRGIGRAVAEALADAGCDLAVTARTLPALDATVRAVAERGRKAVALDGDLAEPGVAAALVDRAAAALGGLDVVVHNAGTLPTAEDGSPLLVPLQHAEQRDWETVVSVNLNATAAVCRAAHPYLVESERASLVLMSSIAGIVGTPMMEAYAATKAAQLSLARSLAVGWARSGVRVNALCPGWTRTDMTAFASEAGALSEWLTSHVPLGRWATVDEVVGATLFLASPASSFVTGHALVVDGGLAVPDGGLAGHPKPPSPFAAAG
ncbi:MULTISPECIES: SDR family NAD(P)-dependent oxidoreductase [Streptomyces]|uniref:SDR family NAD(P)-dependent oxidoreductase n=1 Tax=Streptomyces TaxID=1883 RepID=UPI0002D5C631|nr:MULTISPECIES: SDR family NAD(P)-dependent oxidoreductase [Streptomyces]MYR35955.1 SDR family oxidoreductase [Streptomyces sp. SID4944]MBT3073548.1 SDR family oxidoreductase [Streptomyces sp. COG21]MBT3083458.1 SDR family oxidoreductase [Streptomyces sp. COG20]MBT3088482.1 SDR family oxidoreductase [Streptomyces sp. CYG21]MBT3098294.1 SDR family oxidoreductase [Streptomyces sp. CBG30]